MDNNFPKPNNNLVLAIVCTVLCCLPLGILGIIKATKVDGYYHSGQYALAQQAADDAKKYSLIGMGISAVCYVLYFILLMAGIAE